MTLTPIPSEGLRHSVLYVRFDSDCCCPISNAQALQPESALRFLRDGSSWAALASAGVEAARMNSWLMRVRHDALAARAALIALLPRADGADALNALLAGADLVLPTAAPPELLTAQLARLRQRVAPSPASVLQAHPRVLLQAAKRSLLIDGHAVNVRPQIFRLLWTLASASERLLDPGTLRVVLDIPARSSDEALHTAVGRLRRLLRSYGLDHHIETVHGTGYRWSLDKPAPQGD